jgi:hypothetical protein
MPVAHGATVTVAAEAANARAVSIQLTGSMRQALTGRATVRGFVTSDAAGLEAVEFVGDDTVPTVGAKGDLLSASGAVFEALSNASGEVDLVLTNASDQGKTRYLTLDTGGRLLDPVAIVFADDTP